MAGGENPKPLWCARAPGICALPRARRAWSQIRCAACPCPRRRSSSISHARAARDIRKLIDSAAANAENNHDLVADEMEISEIRVDQGPTLKRWRARARGRATRIEKKTCHVFVSLRSTDE